MLGQAQEQCALYKNTGSHRCCQATLTPSLRTTSQPIAVQLIERLSCQPSYMRGLCGTADDTNGGLVYCHVYHRALR